MFVLNIIELKHIYIYICVSLYLFILQLMSGAIYVKNIHYGLEYLKFLHWVNKFIIGICLTSEAL